MYENKMNTEGYVSFDCAISTLCNHCSSAVNNFTVNNDTSTHSHTYTNTVGLTVANNRLKNRYVSLLTD